MTRTWFDVQKFIDANQLPYKVVRFNMSLAGVLVDTFTDCAVAYTIKDAFKHFKCL